MDIIFLLSHKRELDTLNLDQVHESIKRLEDKILQRDLDDMYLAETWQLSTGCAFP